MSISKSRAPKAERTARALDSELLPDPKDYYASARYLDRRAELGDFSAKGTPAAALPVLRYLWRHTVRNTDNVKLGPNEAPGRVLTGKRKYGKIASELAVSYVSVCRAIEWLSLNEWLDGRTSKDGSYDMRVRMDIEGHKARLAKLGQTVISESTATPEPSSERARPVLSESTASFSESTARDLREKTVQGPNRDVERDFDRDRCGAGPSGKTGPSAQTQDSGHDDIPSGESPADQRAWLESLRSGAKRPVKDPEPTPVNDRSAWDDLSPDAKRDVVLDYARKNVRSGVYATDIPTALSTSYDITPDVRAVLDTMASDGLLQSQGPRYCLADAGRPGKDYTTA